MYRKNTAGQFICIQLILTSTGAVATGLSPAARVCIDGTFGAGGGTFTEDGSTGSYKYALAQADTNGNDISVIVTATGAIPVCVNLVTTAANPTDGVHFGLSALPNTAVTTNGSLLTSGTGTDQISVTSGRIDLGKILGTASAGTAGSVGIDWAQISNKGTAVNLSATQIQSVNNLAVGSDSVNTIATSGSTLTTGTTISGSYVNTATLDGVYWQISDSAGTLDMYFQFNVGATGVPTTAVWTGGLTIAIDTLKVFAFNWAGSSWDQVGTLAGTSSLVVSQQSYDFTTAHVGTGGNLGLVRLRFQNTGLTTANFYTDQVLCGFTNVITYPTNFASLGIDASGNIITVDTVTTVTNQLTAAQIATGVWQDSTSGDFTTVSSIGKSLYTSGVSPGVANGLFIAGTNAATTITTGLTTTFTGNLTGSVGSVTGAVGSVTSPVAVTSNIKKNASSRLTFTMTDSTTHIPKTGLTVAGQVSIDGAAFVALTNTPATEISNGDYTIALVAADTNGNSLMFRFTAPASDDLNIFAVTQP